MNKLSGDSQTSSSYRRDWGAPLLKSLLRWPLDQWAFTYFPSTNNMHACNYTVAISRFIGQNYVVNNFTYCFCSFLTTKGLSPGIISIGEVPSRVTWLTKWRWSSIIISLEDISFWFRTSVVSGISFPRTVTYGSTDLECVKKIEEMSDG